MSACGTYLSIHSSIHLCIFLSVYLSIYLCIPLSLSIYLSACLPVCLSICLSELLIILPLYLYNMSGYVMMDRTTVQKSHPTTMQSFCCCGPTARGASVAVVPRADTGPVSAALSGYWSWAQMGYSQNYG